MLDQLRPCSLRGCVQCLHFGERCVRPGFAGDERQRRAHQAAEFAQADGGAAPGRVGIARLNLAHQVGNGVLDFGCERVLLQIKLEHAEHAARLVPMGQRPGQQPEHLVVREWQLAFQHGRQRVVHDGAAVVLVGRLRQLEPLGGQQDELPLSLWCGGQDPLLGRALRAPRVLKVLALVGHVFEQRLDVFGRKRFCYGHVSLYRPYSRVRDARAADGGR